MKTHYTVPPVLNGRLLKVKHATEEVNYLSVNFQSDCSFTESFRQICLQDA